MQATVSFGITKMDATIPEGIDLVWNGRTINSGPLDVQLDDQAHAEGDNSGELDYETNLARARFNLRIDLSGASRVTAPSLRAREVDATLSGASVALVRAVDALVVRASGASLLEYLGDPRVQLETSGGSAVRRAGP